MFSFKSSSWRPTKAPTLHYVPCPTRHPQTIPFRGGGRGKGGNKSWYGRKHLYQKWRRKKRMYGERYETIDTSTDRTAPFAFLCVSRRARRPGRYPDGGGHTEVSATQASRCFEPWPSTNHTQYLPCSAKQHRHSCMTRQPAQQEQKHRFSRKSDACTKRELFFFSFATKVVGN